MGMSAEHWIPERLPLDRASAARVYDYLLGGYHNFEVDRKVAHRLLETYPEARLGAAANRAFLRRAVHFLIEQGVEQILDLGSGIPTVGNVHEVAGAINPAARVVYVDIDPIAVAHSRAMLEDHPRATAIRADVREPEVILNNPEVQSLLDLDRPLGLLLVTILHYVVDDAEAFGLMRTFHDVMAPGSYCVIAHSCGDQQGKLRMRKIFSKVTSTKARTRAQILQLFDGFELVEPGLVETPLWRPEGPDDIYLDQPEKALTLAGAALKREREPSGVSIGDVASHGG
jgi:hypothetical protein